MELVPTTSQEELVSVSLENESSTDIKAVGSKIKKKKKKIKEIIQPNQLQLQEDPLYQQQLHEKFNILYYCIDTRRKNGFKEEVRPLLPYQIRDLISYKPNDGRSDLLTLAQLKTQRKDISIAMKTVVTGCFALLTLASHVSAYAVCPPLNNSITRYTNPIMLIFALYMTGALTKDCYYLKDESHNNSLSIYLKLQELHNSSLITRKAKRKKRNKQ